MREVLCYAYNYMPDSNNSMEGILYDNLLNPAIDSFLYYQVFACNIL